MSKRHDSHRKSLSNDLATARNPTVRSVPPKAKRAVRSGSKSAAKTKSDLVLAQMRRANGASIAHLMASTGWQAHNLRSFICGLRKQGISIVLSKSKKGSTVYRAEKT